jgi:hypothetical protein
MRNIKLPDDFTHPAGSDLFLTISSICWTIPSKPGQDSTEDRENFQEKNKVTNSGGTTCEGGLRSTGWFATVSTSRAFNVRG